MTRYTRIGLTGANGAIGRVLLAYVVSGNGRRVFDLEATEKDLGYVPQDDAENYFRRVEG